MNAQPTLYIVATPIGTLADMSPRARETLSQVDFIACEDTRRTKELLQALSLPHVQLVSLHEHNESAKAQLLIERLQQSKSRTAALVSDAGTPAISDPGALFVDACHNAQIRIENVPGPSSLVCALAASGFLQPRILFSGFLARSAKEQSEEFKRWKNVAPCIAVCFESPNRIESTLKNAAGFFPAETRVCLSREISKKFEEHLRLPLKEIVQAIEQGHLVKGECILSFEILPDADALLQDSTQGLEFATQEALKLVEANPELHIKELSRSLANKYAVHPKDLYNAIVARRKT